MALNKNPHKLTIILIPPFHLGHLSSQMTADTANSDVLKFESHSHLQLEVRCFTCGGMGYFTPPLFPPWFKKPVPSSATLISDICNTTLDFAKKKEL